VFGRSENYFFEKNSALFFKRWRGKIFLGENRFLPYEGNYFPYKNNVTQFSCCSLSQAATVATSISQTLFSQSSHDVLPLSPSLSSRLIIHYLSLLVLNGWKLLS